jgi:acrylyl-CoA reductase (NADPH)
LDKKFKALRVFGDERGVRSEVVAMSAEEVGAGEVLIRNAYSSINYKDALAATGAGKIMKRFPLVGGIDVAGTVAASTDARFKEGDAVLVTGYGLGVEQDGGYAAYSRVPADWVVPLPAGLGPFDAMAIGTAGFTAALSVLRLEHNGLKPENGPVVVTGASGGVGSLAVDMLAGRGYRVTALSGKVAQHDYLRELGAAAVLDRHGLEMGERPLEKALWAGAVDTVGGQVLAWLTRTMQYHGVIAACGLAGGAELHTTVMPFILRGVSLLGIDSVMCPMDLRREVWRRLGADLKPRRLEEIVSRVVRLDELPQAFADFLQGNVRGRVVVQVAQD